VVASAGVFAALGYLDSERREINTLEDLAGTASRHPAIAAAMAVFLFSLAGIPPLAGFWAGRSADERLADRLGGGRRVERCDCRRLLLAGSCGFVFPRTRAAYVRFST
jgi:hypothetical protein